jgi:hypothetical protein
MSREGKRAVRFMVDSGAKYSLLPLADWRAIDLAPKRRMTFALADGTVTLEILGFVLNPFNRTLQPGRLLLA